MVALLIRLALIILNSVAFALKMASVFLAPESAKLKKFADNLVLVAETSIFINAVVDIADYVMRHRKAAEPEPEEE